MRIWVRVSTLIFLLVLLVFYEVFFFIFDAGFHAVMTTTGIIAYWGIAIIATLIISYLFIAMTRDLKNTRLIIIFSAALLAALFILFLMAIPIQTWWVYYP